MASLFSDPELMKAAMEQMKNMTPSQMAAMQRQMASLSPDLLKQQMDLMGSMSPEMIKQQMDMMKQMPPDQLEYMKQEAEKLGPAGMAQRLKQMQDYQLNGSNQLKADGNALIKQQKYEEALEKYVRAITNLEGIATAPAKELRKACELNSCMCYLKLGQFNKCVEQATKVLREDPSNMKALFRRGDAHLSVGRYKEAVKDLGSALNLAPSGETEIIRQRLEVAEKGLERDSAAAAEADLPSASAGLRADPAETAGTAAPPADQPIAQADAQAEEEVIPPAQPSLPFGIPNVGDLGKMDNQMESMTKMLEDPVMKEMMINMMRGMDSETLAKMTGMPPEQAKFQVERLQGMSDEQFEKVLKSAASWQQMLQKGKQVVKSPWFWVVVSALVFLLLAIAVRFLLGK